MLRLFNSRGESTAYRYTRGHISMTKAADARIFLWRRDDWYHVKAHCEVRGIVLFHDSFTNLATARKRFSQAVATYRKGN